MPTTKTFTLLSSLSVGNKPGQVAIGQCSEILENKMQCWRAGDVVVTVVEPVQTDPETEKEVQKVTTYQKCRRHALAEQEAYAKDTATAQAQEDTVAQDQAALTAAQAKVKADQKATATTSTTKPALSQSKTV